MMDMMAESKAQFDPNPRMHSRMAKGQQRAGNPNRISKPWSANNSPRSSTLSSRRRTESWYGDRLRPWTPAAGPNELPTPPLGVDTTLIPSWDVDMTVPREVHYEPYVPEVKPARPLSWHPSSYQGQQLSGNRQYTSSSAQTSRISPVFNIMGALLPVPSPLDMYTGHTSPPEACSPLSLPASSLSWTPPVQHQSLLEPYEPPAALFPTRPNGSYHGLPVAEMIGPAAYYATPSGFLQPANQQTAQQLPSPVPYVPQSVRLDTHSNSTPYTPDSFVPQSVHADNHIHSSAVSPSPLVNTMPMGQQPRQTQLPQQQSSSPPYVPATPHIQHQQPEPAPAPAPQEEDDDDDGSEILVGLGLYDPPNPPTHTINNTNSLICDGMPAGFKSTGSQGGTRRPAWLRGGAAPAGIGMGMGLKLEEAWTPPESEDEEEGEDGEGEVDA